MKLGDSSELVEISEGKSFLLVPRVESPEEGDVFYNPIQSVSRDISICVYSALDISEFADPLSATGARGVRIASEIPGVKSICSDRNPEAGKLILANFERNSVPEERREILTEDANSLMARRKFRALDIDPFGSPVPFLDMAIRSAVGFLAITATDPAALCGVYPRVTRRKYLAEVRKTEFYHEVGIRILAGYAVRMGGRWETALTPIFAHSTSHYYRVYFSVAKGANRTDAALRRIGFLNWCPNCLFRISSETGGIATCPSCGSGTERIGPLFLGNLFDSNLSDKALKESETRGFSVAGKILAEIDSEESLPSFHYDHHSLCSKARIEPGKLEKFLASLRGEGFLASRTHFSKTGFRTNAPLPRIMELLSSRPGT